MLLNVNIITKISTSSINYAQREMGFSDEKINDAFDGEADAAWNID